MCANARPYSLQASDTLSCSVEMLEEQSSLPHVVEPADIVGTSELTVSFTATSVGRYSLCVKVNGILVSNEIHERTYLAGGCVYWLSLLVGVSTSCPYLWVCLLTKVLLTAPRP